MFGAPTQLTNKKEKAILTLPYFDYPFVRNSSADNKNLNSFQQNMIKQMENESENSILRTQLIAFNY